jgi:hypothetical protein
LDNKIFATNILDTWSLEKAKTMNADTIICNEKRVDIPESASLNIVNAEVYRIPGTFEAYQYNTRVVDSLLSKYKLNINQLDVKKAIPKYVYWTNYKTGYLYACIKAIFPGKKISDVPGFFPDNKIRESLKYIKQFAVNNIRWIFAKNKHQIQRIAGKKTGLLVNDEFELGIFEYLIKEISADDLVIFHYGNIDFSKFLFVKPAIITCDIGMIKRFSPQALFNLFKLSVEELSVVNIMAREWQEISSEIERYRYISTTSVQSLIINVGENLPLKNLMPDIFRGKTKVFNTMNGMKSGEAHDGDVYFDTWFVWDDKMKSMLIRHCGLDEKKLSISGHLMRDFVKDYRFGNTLGIPAEALKGKKVISLFSVRGNREEKMQALKWIYQLAEKDSSYIFLIRPHPLEKAADLDFRESPNKNIFYISYHLNNSKQSLYDQIYVSDLAIVFGSTVAIECQWMHVPCITFEMRDVSNIYSIDNHSIKHVKSLEQLSYLIGNMEKKLNFDKTENNPASVASRILEVINYN